MRRRISKRRALIDECSPPLALGARMKWPPERGQAPVEHEVVAIRTASDDRSESVVVLERAANPRELGFALLLAPNAVHALRQLGVAERGGAWITATAHGTARTFARRLGKESAARWLDETLSEEKAADQKLTQLAESGINQQAARV